MRNQLDDYQMLKVSDERVARRIENMIDKQQPSDLVYYLYARDARDTEDTLTVNCQIVHVVLHANGQTVYRF
jgi:hypothetical protein